MNDPVSKPHLLKMPSQSHVVDQCSNGEKAVSVNQTCRACTTFEKVCSRLDCVLFYLFILFYKSSLQTYYSEACSQSGFIQFLSCRNGDIQPSPCPLTNEETFRRFWFFETAMLLGAFGSFFVGFRRTQHLNRQSVLRRDRRIMQQEGVLKREDKDYSSLHVNENPVGASRAPLLGSSNNLLKLTDNSLDTETSFMR